MDKEKLVGLTERDKREQAIISLINNVFILRASWVAADTNSQTKCFR